MKILRRHSPLHAFHIYQSSAGGNDALEDARSSELLPSGAPEIPENSLRLKLMWYKIENQQVKINILAKPNAKKTALLTVSEQGMQIALHAKPHHGEANKELISYLSMLLRLPKSHIHLLRGESSKHKQVLLPLSDVVQELLNYPEKFIRKKKQEKIV